MPARKQKKFKRYRGSKTHGCGSMKKRRGAGNKGGRGNAGSGKRGDSKKPTMLKNKRIFGKHGFIRPNKSTINTINISYFEEKYLKLKNLGKIKEENGFSVIDLKDFKCQKLLSAGKPTRKYHITALYASEGALTKIKEKGGEVILPKAEKKEVKAKKTEKTDKVKKAETKDAKEVKKEMPQKKKNEPSKK